MLLVRRLFPLRPYQLRPRVQPSQAPEPGRRAFLPRRRNPPRRRQSIAPLPIADLPLSAPQEPSERPTPENGLSHVPDPKSRFLSPPAPTTVPSGDRAHPPGRVPGPATPRHPLRCTLGSGLGCRKFFGRRGLAKTRIQEGPKRTPQYPEREPGLTSIAVQRMVSAAQCIVALVIRCASGRPQLGPHAPHEARVGRMVHGSRRSHRNSEQTAFWRRKNLPVMRIIRVIRTL